MTRPIQTLESELENVRFMMQRLKKTECMRSGKMSEGLLYGLHAAVERYLDRLDVPDEIDHPISLSAIKKAFFEHTVDPTKEPSNLMQKMQSGGPGVTVNE